MLWCRIDFTQCLIFGQQGIGLRKLVAFGLAWRPYEQTCAQKLGRVFCETFS